jgi:Ca2+-binding RTX toxin-like protein
VRAGGGGDFVDGELGDDRVFAGGGSDLLLGGLGNDKLHGGGGDGDLLRGDFGRDLLDGGGGVRDLASFATAADPDGISADLAAGRASGDGVDRLRRVEDLAGSAFGDRLSGDAGPNRIDGEGGDDVLAGAGGDDLAYGGPGGDVCRDFAVTDSCEGHRQDAHPELTSVELTAGLEGAALTVRGSDAANRIRVSRAPGGFAVSDSSGLDGGALSGCRLVTAEQAFCEDAGRLAFALIDAGGGDDEVTISGLVPLTVPVRIAGGDGSDRLIGGRGDDVIDGGDGPDHLIGHSGADALVSSFGPDVLAGGSGADLLVSAGACAGDSLRGGDGTDSASFARVIAGVVRARIGARAVNLSRIRDGLHCAPVRIQASVENLEGSPGADILIGDAGRNNLIGRGGADTLIGRAGRDRLVGGGKADALIGGKDPDLLYARDGRRDRRLSCGPGAGRLQRASRDRSDPPASGC